MAKRKTSLYVDAELDRALTQAAAMTQVSKAEFIRRTLADAVTHLQETRPQARGVFHGPSDAAENVDRYLRDTGFGT